MEHQSVTIEVAPTEPDYGLVPRAGVGPGRALIVGITTEGSVPLTEDFEPMARRPIIGLPSIAFEATPFEQLGVQLAARLPAELGYQARELVSMRSDFGGGDSPRSPFFLAPLLKPAGWRARVGFVPGVREIPLRDMRRYLSRRFRGGAVVSPLVRQGLFLAEEFFPLWARERLGRAIQTLETRRAQTPATA